MRRPAGALFVLLLVIGLSATARSESASGVAEEGDMFSNGLTTGDFDGNGRQDLAVGVPGEDIGGHSGAGAVNVIYGTSSGLTKSGNEVWYQGTVDVLGGPEPFDQFGADLAVGDFDDDGFDDLAIGVLGEDISGQENAGAVNVIYGSNEGLTVTGNQLLTQEEINEGDIFGRSLAAGDFNNDGKDDLAVGAPGEDLETSGVERGGVVDRFFGSDTGLSETGSQLTQTGLDHDLSEDDDEFGWSLAAGNLGAGAADDLIIGVPAESLGEPGEGALHVVYGGTGFSVQQFWHQDVPGIANTTENGDDFARSLTVGNFGHGSPADLAVGAPREDVEIDAGEVNSAGVVHVLYGTSEVGLTEDNDQLWHQSKPGVADRIEVLDQFGDSLSAGDLGKSGRTDLVIGVYWEDLNVDGSTKTAGGVVHVLFGTNGGLKAKGDQLWHQNVDGVKDSVESNDFFGFALATGNFGSGSTSDLAIGVRTEGFGTIEDAGAANVLYGTADGLSPSGDQFWHQTVP
jgi:hypothetical protein